MEVNVYTRRAAAIPVIFAALLLSACSKENERPVSPTVQSYSQSAERQVERGAALADDAAITAKVKAALVAEPDVKGLAIDVDTSGNVVSLKGFVPNDDTRKRAEQIASRVDGVKEVKNSLVVKAAP